MSKAKVYDRDGFELDDYGARVVRDGQFVRVPMHLTDGKPPAEKEPPKLLTPYLDNRPKSANVEDAERERREKQQQSYDQRIGDAWKGEKEKTT